MAVVIMTMTIIQMFKNCFLVFALVFLGVASPCQGKMFGLFYGCNGDDLNYAENDVKALADLYRKNNGNVILIRGDMASRKIVTDYLTKQSKACSEDDIFIFAYSGHGCKNCISTCDGFLNFVTIKNIVKKHCKAKRKVFILDSCFSGNFANISILGNEGTTLVITSARKNEMSFEGGFEEHGELTQKIIEAFSGKADYDKDKRITVKELYRYCQSGSMLSHVTMKGRFNDSMLLYTIKK